MIQPILSVRWARGQLLIFCKWLKTASSSLSGCFLSFFLKCRFWKATGLTSSRDNDAYTGSDVLEHLRSWEFWFLFMHSMPAPPGKPAHLFHGRVGIPRELQGLSLWQDRAHSWPRMTSTDLWTFFLEQGLAAATSCCPRVRLTGFVHSRYQQNSLQDWCFQAALGARFYKFFEGAVHPSALHSWDQHGHINSVR